MRKEKKYRTTFFCWFLLDNISKQPISFHDFNAEFDLMVFLVNYIDTRKLKTSQLVSSQAENERHSTVRSTYKLFNARIRINGTATYQMFEFRLNYSCVSMCLYISVFHWYVCTCNRIVCIVNEIRYPILHRKMWV